MRETIVKCDMCAKVVKPNENPELDEPVVAAGFAADPLILCGVCAGKRPKRMRFEKKVIGEMRRRLIIQMDEVAQRYDKWAAKAGK